MKSKWIIACLLLITAHSFAQNDIRKEIIAFTDSTEMMIRNGRKLVVDKTITGHVEEAMQTFNFLKEHIDKSYVVFYPMEELLISLATSNFELFLYTAANFNTLLEGKTKAVQMEPIAVQLQQYIADELPLIKKDLARAVLYDGQKEFIKLYIQYFEENDKMALSKAVKLYEKKYPDNEYSQFTRDLKQYATTGFMNIVLGYGHEFLNGNTANSFTNHFQIMELEVDWFINRFYLSLFINGSVSEIEAKQALPIKKMDMTHPLGANAFSLKYGTKVGRSWVSNKTFNLFSSVSIGGYQINSDKSNFENADTSTKYKLSDSFFTGLGTSCDITLKNFHATNTLQKTGSVFIRPNVGYDFLLSKNSLGQGNSFYFLVSMGFGFGG